MRVSAGPVRSVNETLPDFARLARDPRDVILRVLRAASGRTRCFDHYLPSREFSRDTDFIPAISYTRHCVSYLIS